MLVLSRRKTESVVIADNIELTILEIRGGKVKLGLRCPREIPIHRAEVYRQIERERETQPMENAVEQTL